MRRRVTWGACLFVLRMGKIRFHIISRQIFMLSPIPRRSMVFKKNFITFYKSKAPFIHPKSYKHQIKNVQVLWQNFLKRFELRRVSTRSLRKRKRLSFDECLGRFAEFDGFKDLSRGGKSEFMATF